MILARHGSNRLLLACGQTDWGDVAQWSNLPANREFFLTAKETGFLAHAGPH
jgi:hypothetical protein